tara:strand:+ start:1411 stop:1611 length:201 start_codon:yes stop_codon:yes gene_type:complete
MALWSGHESKQFLKEYAEGIPIDTLRERYGRSDQALRSRAAVHGVRRSSKALTKIRGLARRGNGEK